MIYYDKQNSRLVQIQEEATPDFWDSQWTSLDLKNAVIRSGGNRVINAVTTQYLPIGSRVLEGGCGIGKTVYGLSKLGYDVHGVDTAENTINEIKEHFPELIVSLQDVRALEYSDETFHGCWSIGVIEHFWDGYFDIIQEAYRILKPGGFFFLIFPYMSPLRKFKARIGLYEEFSDSIDRKAFYQFMLDPDLVESRLVDMGFSIVSKKPLDGTKGMKDEVAFLRPVLQSVYDSKRLFGKVLNYVVSKMAGSISGHSILLVCQKTGE